MFTEWGWGSSWLRVFDSFALLLATIIRIDYSLAQSLIVRPARTRHEVEVAIATTFGTQSVSEWGSCQWALLSLARPARSDKSKLSAGWQPQNRAWPQLSSNVQFFADAHFDLQKDFRCIKTRLVSVSAHVWERKSIAPARDCEKSSFSLSLCFYHEVNEFEKKNFTRRNFSLCKNRYSRRLNATCTKTNSLFQAQLIVRLQPVYWRKFLSQPTCRKKTARYRCNSETGPQAGMEYTEVTSLAEVLEVNENFD